MTILNIAEKPSVAKSISRILSTNCRTSKGVHKYCSNIYFETEINSKQKEMVFSSVLGHVYELRFVNQDKNWNGSDPKELFDAEITNVITEDNQSVAKNIRNLSNVCEMVIIWTDCDREGENIAMQIKNIVRTANKTVSIKRARFSAISRFEIDQALNNLVEINYNEANAVECRKELDLRVGSSFTRIQTTSYNKDQILSFGPCQIPCLNFVVQRHFQIVNFKPENFYGLENTLNKDVFKWKRNHLFDKNCVIHFYNILSNGKAKITNKTVTNKEKYRPLPLRTVEFQKACSSYYKIGGHKIMEIAEKLYSDGYISYPRTETDSFPKNFGFQGIINKLQNDEKLGEYASNFAFKYPRGGTNNDQAHSPIYPLKDGSSLQGDSRKIYEFVARRFLGCISENAKGLETSISMQIRNNDIAENFYLTGLNITERNYLEVYIYDKWESYSIGEYKVGDLVENNLEIKEGQTTKPEYLTEADLIGLMDKNEIGTDATIHEHIQKIQNRKYVIKSGFRFVPLQLGINLINSYNTINLPISEPTLRRDLEKSLKRICIDEKSREEVLFSEIRSQKMIYDKLFENIELFKDIMLTPGSNINTEDDEINKIKTEREYSKKIKLSNNENIKCECNSKAKLLETKKEENRGKLFYCCGCYPKKCSFFQWKDSVPNLEIVTKPKLLHDKKPIKDEVFKSKPRIKTEAHIEEIKCYCGYDPIKKTANTEINKGRVFFACNKNYKKCKFFKWADE